MESGFRDLNVQFLDYIQTLFTENDGEDLSDRLRALVEEYDKHAETLIEEAGGKGQREEDEEETAAAHDADEDGDEGGDEDNGDETVQGSPAQEGNFFGAQENGHSTRSLYHSSHGVVALLPLLPCGRLEHAQLRQREEDLSCSRHHRA